VAEVSAVDESTSDVDDTELVEEEVDEPLVTRQEAQSALNLVRRFIEKNSADPFILGHSDALDDYFYQERKKNEKQSKITDFF
jgi:hypothetical protein